MSNQCTTFLCLWIYRHGSVKPLQADSEYNNGYFHKLCDDRKIELRIVAASHYVASEAVERVSRTLRMTYNCIRSTNRCS